MQQERSGVDELWIFALGKAIDISTYVSIPLDPQLNNLGIVARQTNECTRGGLLRSIGCLIFDSIGACTTPTPHTLSSKASPCTCTQNENPKDRGMCAWGGSVARHLCCHPDRRAWPHPLTFFSFSFFFHVAQSLSRYYKYDLLEYPNFFLKMDQSFTRCYKWSGVTVMKKISIVINFCN